MILFHDPHSMMGLNHHMNRVITLSGKDSCHSLLSGKLLYMVLSPGHSLLLSKLLYLVSSHPSLVSCLLSHSEWSCDVKTQGHLGTHHLGTCHLDTWTPEHLVDTWTPGHLGTWHLGDWHLTPGHLGTQHLGYWVTDTWHLGTQHLGDQHLTPDTWVSKLLYIAKTPEVPGT